MNDNNVTAETLEIGDTVYAAWEEPDPDDCGPVKIERMYWRRGSHWIVARDESGVTYRFTEDCVDCDRVNK